MKIPVYQKRNIRIKSKCGVQVTGGFCIWECWGFFSLAYYLYSEINLVLSPSLSQFTTSENTSTEQLPWVSRTVQRIA